MKVISIRRSAFETNSSSTHSVVIKPANLPNDGHACLDINDEGELVVSTGEFGWEYGKYRYFSGKLSYLVTHIFDSFSENKNKEIELSNLEEVLSKNISGFKKLKIENPDDGYVDHQSSDIPKEILQDKQKIEDFLFSSNSILITDNDN